MKKLLFIILFFFVSNFCVAQTYIKNSQAKTISYIKDKIVFNTEHKVLYNYKGFIVFKEESKNKNDIALTLDVRKNKTFIYNKVETQVKWIIKKENVIWKKGRQSINVLNIKKQDGFTSFYNVSNDSLIGFVDTEELTDPELSIAFFQLWEILDLEEMFLKQLETISYDINSDLPKGIIGSMKPVFGDEYNIWYWDGKHFFPALSNDQRYVWEFDGEILKPIWNSKMENEWSWDGEELSPYWGGHPRNNWRWENGILRQIFENNYKNEYEIVDNVIRKRFGSFSENEWEIEGKIPLPVISLIVLKIVNR